HIGSYTDSGVSAVHGPYRPVVTTVPVKALSVPSDYPLCALAQLRVTDAYASRDRLGTLARLGEVYKPGDTDFTWTRLTAWRTLLASSLDQAHDDIKSGIVEAEPDSPSAELLASWLSVRLGVPVKRVEAEGPGINAVRLTTKPGDIAVPR